jgi:preprotein translocase subunit SecE
VTTFFQELFSFGIYKKTQGKIARQVTFAVLAVIVALGAWSWSEYFRDRDNLVRYYVPLTVLAVGLWASFRVVQMPPFADFLISVEGEMNKVSWPSRGELFRASIVVMAVIFFLAALLFSYDLILTELLRLAERLIAWLFD